MEKRRLGKSGILVNPVGLGCMGFSHAMGKAVEHDEAVKTLREAYEAGYDFFDTAEVYRGTFADGTTSYNEELVGTALRDVRDKVVIATKMGVWHNEDLSLRVDARPEVIRKSIDESLKRLGTDYVDLYYQHRIDPKVAPEEVASTMADLIKEGKIRSWGISEATEDYLRRANAVCPVTAIENRYSMMARWHESIFPVCEELDVAFVAFSPMANGFLTGKYSPQTKFEGKDDFRADMPQYQEEGYQKAQPLLKLLAELAEKYHATDVQISLAWMICKKPYIIPIPGSRKISRLKENFAAADIQLGADEIARIDEALSGMKLEVFGGHKPKTIN